VEDFVDITNIVKPGIILVLDPPEPYVRVALLYYVLFDVTAGRGSRRSRGFCRLIMG